MIKVVFVRRTPEESWLNNVKTYWVDNRDCSEIWRFKHCYIIAGNKRITNRHDAAVEELSEEEAVVDNKVFNLSQRVDEELGIRLLEVNTY